MTNDLAGPDQPKDVKEIAGGIGCLAVTAIAALFVLVQCTGGDDNPKADPKPTHSTPAAKPTKKPDADAKEKEGWEAQAVCKDFIKKQMGVDDADWSDVKHIDLAGSWTVNGTVKTEEASGPFTCVMKVEGQDWVTVKPVDYPR